MLRLGNNADGDIRYEVRELASIRLVAQAVRLWQHSWRGPMRETDEDSWWDWRDFLVRTIGRTEELLGFALVTREHPTLGRFVPPLAGEHLQGLMLIEPTWAGPEARAETRVWYLATAPWNRHDRDDAHRLSGVGTVLVAASVRIALARGHHGVVCLVPYVGAIPFYAQLGFRKRIIVDPFDEPRRDLVLDPPRAETLLARVEASFEAHAADCF